MFLCQLDTKTLSEPRGTSSVALYDVTGPQYIIVVGAFRYHSLSHWSYTSAWSSDFGLCGMTIFNPIEQRWNLFSCDHFCLYKSIDKKICHGDFLGHCTGRKVGTQVTFLKMSAFCIFFQGWHDFWANAPGIFVQGSHYGFPQRGSEMGTHFHVMTP